MVVIVLAFFKLGRADKYKRRVSRSKLLVEARSVCSGGIRKPKPSERFPSPNEYTAITLMKEELARKCPGFDELDYADAVKKALQRTGQYPAQE